MFKITISVFSAVLFFLFLPGFASAQVVINELVPDPSSDDSQDEWIELYNKGSESLDLIGYKLIDASSHTLVIENNYTDGSTIIPAGGWLVIYRKGSGFSLNNTGTEAINLFNTIDIDPIDSFSYTGSTTDMSWGRIPDGGDIYSQVLVSTLGASNVAPAPTTTPMPTPDPTKTPTPIPTATSTPLATRTPTATPKATNKASSSPSSSPNVLGESVSSLSTSTPSPTPEPKPVSSFNLLPFAFIGAGTVFLGAAFFPFLKSKFKGYNNSDVKNP